MIMASSENKNVLVVAQDQQTRQWLTTWLNNQGFNAMVTENAESAQGQIRSSTSLVISDIDDPQVDINRLTQIVKSESSNVPVIVVAGPSSADSAVQSIRNGVTDFLMKPINSLELSAKMSRALNEQRLQQELASLQDEKQNNDVASNAAEKDGGQHQGVKSLQVLEREAIIDALDRFDGARGKTAKALGISVRTLQRKIKEYGYTNGGAKPSSYAKVNQ